VKVKTVGAAVDDGEYVVVVDQSGSGAGAAFRVGGGGGP
jgi:hypothetical protein